MQNNKRYIYIYVGSAYKCYMHKQPVQTYETQVIPDAWTIMVGILYLVMNE